MCGGEFNVECVQETHSLFYDKNNGCEFCVLRNEE